MEKRLRVELSSGAGHPSLAKGAIGVQCRMQEQEEESGGSMSAWNPFLHLQFLEHDVYSSSFGTLYNIFRSARHSTEN